MIFYIQKSYFGFYDFLYTKKLHLVGIILFIVILKNFFLALCQNSFNEFFSTMNQIESYLIFRRLARDISY